MHPTPRPRRRPRRARPSLSLVVALLALVVASGGTGYAAGLGRNTVGPDQLRTNAVTNPKIAAGAVSGAKIRPDAVVGSRVAPDTLTGADIDEDSLVGGTEGLVMSGLQFTPLATDNTYVRNSNGCVRPVGSTVTLETELDLPDRAEVTSLRFYALDQDSSAGDDVTVSISLRGEPGAAPSNAGQASTSGVTATTVLERPVDLTVAVVSDRADRSILVTALVRGDTAFCGIRILYQGASLSP